jgi:hypothetical protein
MTFGWYPWHGAGLPSPVLGWAVFVTFWLIAFWLDRLSRRIGKAGAP